MIGQVIAGRYEIIRQLGAGAMGAVYQARQLSMDRMVALKLIHPHIVSEEVARRFHREMKATSKIEHPNTIAVFDFGADDSSGQLFLAMEYLEGRPLSKLLEEAGALPLPRIVHIASQVVRALGAAHAEGIAHRDLKPDNIMLVDRYGEHDVVKVLDFGIARFVDGDAASQTKMTHDGAVVGTPVYMSPEQAMGQPVDHRADFYSLGVMLYQMALGRLPFVGTTLAALLVAHATQKPPAPSEVAPGVMSPAFEALVLRLLAKSPAERPATAADVLRALEGLVPEPTQPPQPPLPIVTTAETPRPPTRARRPLWPAVAVGLAIVGGAAVIGVRLATREKVDAAARARFDAVIAAEGDPPTPAECRSNDGALVERLARAGSWLHDSAPGAPRPQDRDALALLATTREADTSAEYWALLSRARLVVEPTAEGALAAGQRAVERCPALARAHNAVGGAALRGHDDAVAMAAFGQAVKLAPDYLAPRFNLGLLALRGKDATTAIAAFDAVLAKDPLHPRAHLARGQARVMSGDYAGALDDLEQATLRHPADGDAWLLLGKARVATGARKTAVEAFCRARALGVAAAAELCPTG